MQVTAVKKGKILILLEMLNDIPDGQTVTLEIIENRTHSDIANFGEGLEEFRRANNIEELELDIEEIFKDIRDQSSGREVIL
ncbi:MAG: hypothetical protein F6K31_20185 [Symploca sp. SIO2G7]|nr:hypothetical protein [Symploca sp. SIO2G7]